MTTDIINVTHLVQLALTPAFLLSGIGTVLVVLSSRLSRIVDRSHQLNDQIQLSKDKERSGCDAELNILDLRCKTIHKALFFCSIAAFCVCAVIITIYLGKLYLDSEITGLLVGWLFSISMTALTISLFLLMKEVRICSEIVRSSSKS